MELSPTAVSLLHILDNSTGSRVNKQWFLVKDSKQAINAVLTMTPWSSQTVIDFTKATKKTLKELFSLLQVCILFKSRHPCIVTTGQANYIQIFLRVHLYCILISSFSMAIKIQGSCFDFLLKNFDHFHQWYLICLQVENSDSTEEKHLLLFSSSYSKEVL